VGPVLRAGDIAEAAVAAAHLDNPGVDLSIEDRVAYVRLHAPAELMLRRASIEELLGRPFGMHELGVVLAAFAGRVETTTEYFRFFSNADEQGA
jgi:toluene monooxygenase system protein D